MPSRVSLHQESVLDHSPWGELGDSHDYGVPTQCSWLPYVEIRSHELFPIVDIPEGEGDTHRLMFESLLTYPLEGTAGAESSHVEMRNIYRADQIDPVHVAWRNAAGERLPAPWALSNLHSTTYNKPSSDIPWYSGGELHWHCGQALEHMQRRFVQPIARFVGVPGCQAELHFAGEMPCCVGIGSGGGTQIARMRFGLFWTQGWANSIVEINLEEDLWPEIGSDPCVTQSVGFDLFAEVPWCDTVLVGWLVHPDDDDYQAYPISNQWVRCVGPSLTITEALLYPPA